MKKAISILGAIYFFSVSITSCGEEKRSSQQKENTVQLEAKEENTVQLEAKEEISDRPSKTEVKIGDQIWMTENLNVSTFRNGDSIPHAENDEQWKAAAENKKAIWAYYDYDEGNEKKLGRLYNWWAVNDKRNIAPEGWHVASNAEWTKLIDFLGGYKIAGKKLKSSKGWSKNGNGTNEVGFFGIPSGTFHFLGGGQGILEYAQWWSSTKMNEDQAYAPSLSFDKDEIITFNPRRDYGFSVRCIKN
jgi:uncharacterized protein (TIGR02145 family)